MDHEHLIPGLSSDDLRLQELQKFRAELEELRRQSDLRLKFIESALERVRARLASLEEPDGSEPGAAKKD